MLFSLYLKCQYSNTKETNELFTGTTENVYAWTGKYPALNAFDFINIHASKDVNKQGWLDYSDLTPVTDWYNAGGVVGCMWHWQVPANNGDEVDIRIVRGTRRGYSLWTPGRDG